MSGRAASAVFAKKRRGTGTDVALNMVIATTVVMIMVDGVDDGGGSDNDDANDGSDLCLGLGSMCEPVKCY